MKKIALFLVFAIILASCFAVSSCGNSSEDDAIDKGIQKAIQRQMVRELSYINAGRTSENQLYLQQTTITSKKALDSNGETYEVYGTQKFKDVYDTTYVATFNAEVVKTSDGYSAAIKKFGSLTKQ